LVTIYQSTGCNIPAKPAVINCKHRKPFVKSNWAGRHSAGCGTSEIASERDKHLLGFLKQTAK